MLHQKKSSKINDAQVFTSRRAADEGTKRRKRNDARRRRKEAKRSKGKKSATQAIRKYKDETFVRCIDATAIPIRNFAYTENGLKLKAMALLEPDL